MKIIQLDDGIKIPASKIKTMLAWLGCVAFVALCIWLIFYTDAVSGDENTFGRIFCWAGICFFGIGVICLPAILFHSKSGLYISSKGFTVVTPFVKQSFVSWNEIEGFGETKIRSTKLLAVYLKNESEYLARLNSFQRSLAEASINLVGTPYSLTANSFQSNFSELKEVLQANFEKYSAPNSTTQ